MTDTNEYWEDIPAYEGYYQVSTYGNLRSLTRSVNNRWGTTTVIYGKTLAPKTDAGGYLVIGLTKDKKKTFFSVHRLVARTFLTNTDNKQTVNHRDGDKKNNHLDNLEWATHSEQVEHALTTNLITPHGGHIYSEEFKENVYNYYKETQCSIKYLAIVFGISERTAGRIAAGKTSKTIRKLCADDAAQIKQLRNDGLTLTAIAAIFNCSVSQVHRITRGQSHAVQYER